MHLIIFYNDLDISGRRPKNTKKNQKPDISPQAIASDLDTSKLATESLEQEVYIFFNILHVIAIVIHAF